MTKKLQWHPSYGWATEKQIQKLREISDGPEKKLILKEIEKQTYKRKGR